MILLSAVTFLAGFCIAVSGSEENSFLLANNFHIHVKDNKVLFNFANKYNDGLMKGEFRVSQGAENLHSPKVCGEDSHNCVQFGPDLTLKVESKGECSHTSFSSTSNVTLFACFQYGNDSWYGGPENWKQYYPFNNMTFNRYSYVTKQDGNQAIVEPYWLTSSGNYYYVDKSVPLFIDSNTILNDSFCIISSQTPPYLPRLQGSYLGFQFCSFKNPRLAHMNAVKTLLGKPSGIPDQRMVQHPIWSTWVRFKKDVNDSAVRDFAKQIVDNGFNNSQIEIDDNWETCYGSGRFNETRFPNATQLSMDLKQMGFRVTLWTHPFVNENCPLYKQLQSKGYLVSDQDGNTLSTWWDGAGGVIDFTNNDAAQWFLDRRNTSLTKNNIDSLKMDAGETSWLPQIPKLTADVEDQPNAFTAAYVRKVAEFGSMVEVRSGYGTQDLPIFIRMIDKDSKWTFDNGLPTLLTTLFQMNLNGYTLVLPDMVGGNAYGTDVVTKEMFIRWLQANTFMPSIQFSAAPWDFDDETVEISKKFTELHYAHSDHIIKQMQKSVSKGMPVNMPIWWVAPKDKTAHGIWSEYMLGDDLLVAPVVEQGAVTRDIYLPKGKWRDEVDPKHKVHRGPKWLRDYPAPLDTLPYFVRVSKRAEDLED